MLDLLGDPDLPPIESVHEDLHIQLYPVYLTETLRIRFCCSQVGVHIFSQNDAQLLSQWFQFA